METGGRWTFEEFIQLNIVNKHPSAWNIAHMLNGARDCLAVLHLRHGLHFFPEQLFVENTPDIKAETCFGSVIYVSRGLIDYFLTLDTTTLGAKMPQATALLPIGHEGWGKTIPMVWTVAHEFFHGLRRHTEAEEQFGSDPVTMQASEYDADLLAAAVIYRRMEAGDTGFDALGARCVAYYYIANCILGFPMPPEDSTHPSHAERMFFIGSKLASLPPDGEEIDRDCELPVTRQRVEEFAPFWAAVVRESGLKEEFKNAAENRPISKRWDEYRHIVGTVSGTRT